MFRKFLWVGLGAGALALFFFGKDTFSYLTTSAGWMKDSVKDSVPVEFEIERTRQMLKNLQPDIRRNLEIIAREEVELERLSEDIARNEEELQTDEAKIRTLKSDLETGNAVFYYAGNRYSEDQVRHDLAKRFSRFKTAEKTLENQRKMYEARQRSLESARKKLEGMLAAKQQLEVDVEHLQARLQMVEAAQTTSDYNFDDSRLSRIKESIGELKTRLDVAEKMVGVDKYFAEEIPVDEPAEGDVVDQINAYFDGQSMAEDTSAAVGAE